MAKIIKAKQETTLKQVKDIKERDRWNRILPRSKTKSKSLIGGIYVETI